MSEEQVPPSDAAEMERFYNHYRADFLWQHEEGSVEEAGYEFANARTEEYRELWWNILKSRMCRR